MQHYGFFTFLSKATYSLRYYFKQKNSLKKFRLSLKKIKGK